MSSSLDGRRVVVTTPVPGADVGEMFWVLGNALAVAEARIYFLGTPSGHRALPSTRRVPRARERWSDEDKAEARRLQAEGVSWSRIAERVCGDRTKKSTVQQWLRPKTSVARNGDGSRCAPGVHGASIGGIPGTPDPRNHADSR